MRLKLVGIVAVALLMAAAPLPARALLGDVSAAPAPAPVSDSLQAGLAAAGPGTELELFVHAEAAATARSAVTAAGARLAFVFGEVAAVAAVATPAQIEAMRSAPGVRYLEGATKWRPLTETSHVVTRGAGLKTAAGADLDGSGSTVAIVDTGVDGSHPAIKDNMARNFKVVCPFYICDENDESIEADTGVDPDIDQYGEEAQFVDVGRNGNSETPVEGGHGTHVASTAAGQMGAAKKARIVAFGVSAYAFYGADAALHWLVRHGADPCGDGSCPPVVSVNNSYGPEGGGSYNPNRITAKIQDRLVAQGVTVVWAAGNDGNRGTTNATNPNGQSPTPGVVMVAAYDDGGTTSRDEALAGFSSRGLRYGLRKDSSGKVVETRNTYPDVTAPGTNITAACRPTTPLCGASPGAPDKGTISGTSMAAPHVTGIVAQLQQASRAAGRGPVTPAQVEQVLEDTAHRFTAGARYEPDPFNPSSPTSYDKGHGLVDVAAAVAALGGPAAPPAPPPPCDGETADLSDPAGDTIFLLTTNTEPYSPALDVRDGGVAWDAVKAEFALTLELAGVQATPPPTDATQLYKVRFEHGLRRFEVEVRRNVTATTVSLRDADTNTAITIPAGAPRPRAQFTTGTPGRLTVIVPAATIAAVAPTLPPISAGTQLGEIEAATARLIPGGTVPGVVSLNGLIAFADDAVARCPVTLTTDAVLTADRSDRGRRTTISAVLTEAGTGAPLAGRELVFAVNGQVLARQTTDGTGAASVVTTRLRQRHVVTVTFNGGGGHRTTSVTVSS